MGTLTLTTCQAPNMDFLCRDLADYLSARLDTPVRAVLDVPWQERQRLFDAGEIDLGWICGLPYVVRADANPGRFFPVVAPVMLGGRYASRPVYFSDVVVRADSHFLGLDDLRGAAWAYNEPGSHSGYGVVRWALAQRGETLAFFGRVVESGAHQASLQMILRGEIDASAIDSTVLEQEIKDDPSIAGRIRVIDTFGPSPIPPWVSSMRTPFDLRNKLRKVLTGMAALSTGRELLARAGISRFASVEDADYDPVREMRRIASEASRIAGL